jgi:hypothetical protein
LRTCGARAGADLPMTISLMEKSGLEEPNSKELPEKSLNP